LITFFASSQPKPNVRPGKYSTNRDRRYAKFVSPNTLGRHSYLGLVSPLGFEYKYNQKTYENAA
jgi:hypothetical protein